MAKPRSKGKAKGLNLGAIAAVSILLAAAILITINDQFDLFRNLPTWHDLYRATGLTDAKATSADVSVHFLDVGQGDSELILTPTAAVLIDAGENDKGEAVLAYLKAQGVKRLDYVIGTHPHSDHIGGLDTVMQGMEVGTVILPKVSDALTPTTRTYEDLLDVISSKGLQVTAAKAGSTYDLGDGTSLTLFAPVKGAEYDNLNNYSVVCRFTHGSNSFLFMGDAEKEVEHALLEARVPLQSTVLKVGHHGSATSSTLDFLKAVSMRYAVISVGAGNSYGLPSQKICNRLYDNADTVLRTDLGGTIVFESDGESLSTIIAKQEGK